MKNKKRKLLVILTVMVLLLCSISIMLYAREKFKTKEKEETTIIVEKEKTKDIIEKEDESDKTGEKKELDEENLSTELENKDNTVDDNVEKSNNSNSSNNLTTSNNNPTPTNPQSKTEIPVQEQPKQSPTVWEQLGISEYDYYNSPMLSWQKVTHSDFDSCRASGEDAIKVKINQETGESYQDYTNYWCYDVNSYSGRNLGVMLDLE